MQKIISSVAPKIMNSNITLIGETHIVVPHRVLECQLLSSLSASNLDSVFLELDTVHQKQISYVTNLELSAHNTQNAFTDSKKNTQFDDFIDKYSKDPANPTMQKKLLQYYQDPNYSFLYGMCGNIVSYHMLLKTAAANFKHVHAIDKYLGNDNPHAPKSIIKRNQHMADQIAAGLRKGHKGVAIVGADHLRTYVQDGVRVPSLQDELLSRHNIQAETLMLADYRSNLHKISKQSEFDAAYPDIMNTFQENSYFLQQGECKSSHAPNYIAGFPKQTLVDNFMKSPEEIELDENTSLSSDRWFQAEKKQWNDICRQQKFNQLLV